MRHLLLCISFLLIINTAQAQVKFTVNGEVKDNLLSSGGLKNGDTVSLEFSNLKKKFYGVINQNRFTITGEISEPMHGMLEYKGSGCKLLVDNNSTYDVLLQVVEVSPNRYTYKESIKTNSKFHNHWSDFYEHYYLLVRQKRNLEGKIDSALNDEIAKKIKVKLANVDAEIYKAYRNLADQHPDNLATAYVLPAAPDFSYKNYIDSYNKLSLKVRNSTYGKQLLEKLTLTKGLENPSINKVEEVINQPFPLVSAVDTIGKVTQLSKGFFSANRYTLIEFWASWCVPCREVNRNLAKRESYYRNKGMRIIGFSLDENIAPWKVAIRKDKTQWLQLSDFKAANSPLAVFLNLAAIPANVVVNSKGKIIAQNVYDTTLDELLK